MSSFILLLLFMRQLEKEQSRNFFPPYLAPFLKSLSVKKVESLIIIFIVSCVLKSTSLGSIITVSSSIL